MRAATERPGLSVEDLEFDYGDPAFRLSVPELRVAPGEHVALVGPSGSGKSTLLKLLAGILLPRRGRVALDGLDWAGADEAARRRVRLARIGLVFQELELLEHLSVEENVLLPFFVDPALRPDREARGRARELAREAGIERYLARRPGVLSQGERQRAAVCRALVTGPDVLLADEPTGNLDAATGRAVVDLMLRVARGREAAVVVVTHDASLADRFDRVVDVGELAGKSEP